MAWYVIRSNIKSEDKAERNLRKAGFRTYAPWQKFERFNRRKKVWIEHSMRLAPRYIFVETPDQDVPWYTLRACEGVECVLGVDGRPIALNGVQTEQLQALMDAEADYAFDETRAGKLHRREIGKTKRETSRMKFPPGVKVRVTDGPFTSFNGEVTNVNGRGHLEVMVSIFGRLTPVEMEPKQVERVANAA